MFVVYDETLRNTVIDLLTLGADKRRIKPSNLIPVKQAAKMRKRW